MQQLMLIVQLIPAIVAAMKAVEEALPGQGAGEQKLALVRAIVENGYGTISDLWPKMMPIISQFVAVFNAIGLFKK